MKKLVIILACTLYAYLLSGQAFTWTENNGDINYSSNLPSSHMHFYMFDDGYYRKGMNPTHFYSNGAHTTGLYEIANKEGENPRHHGRSMTVGPHTNPGPNPHQPLSISGSIETKPSWNITSNYFGMLLLEFENDFKSGPSSGCIELHYNPAVLSIAVNTDTMGWATLQSHLPGQISWTYTNLMPDEQRVLYLPTNSLVASGSSYVVAASIADNCLNPITSVSKYKTHTVPHDPNNKLTMNTDHLAETWRDVITQFEVPQEVVYRVNFHNDGNNFAQDVYVFDQIHPDADPSSIQFLGSSHPCTFNVNWYLMEVHFDDIYLPGAGQNDPQIYPFEETSGYYEYSVCIPKRVNALECQETNAEIYFDAIGPVLAQNVICADDTQPHENPCSMGNSQGQTDLKSINWDENSSSDIELSPLPARDYIKVKGINSYAKLTVFGQAGQLIPVDMKISGNTAELDIRSLSKGFYIVEIKTEDSATYEKFIKQ